MDRPQWLTEISTAIADGEPVDWAAVDARQMTDQDRELVDRFRVLERIARTRASSSVSLSDIDGEQSRANDGDDSSDDLTTWGALTQLEKIGSGAFGDVYRAYDPRLDRTVALKLLRSRETHGADLESQVIEEARLLARVHHPNVVTVYGAERIDDRVGLWMEYIEGRTLEDEVVQDGPKKPEEILKIGLDLCSALQAVHRAGVLHLDLKAQNVMRMPTGRVVLTDFGVAKDILRRSPDERFELAGTPLYVAPELLEGQEPSVRSEVYSLGVLLFYLASGSFPIRARTLRSLRDAHIREARLRLRDARAGLPRRIAALVERATNPDPTKRYQTISQLERAMRRLLSARLFASRKWWVAAAAVLGAAAGYWFSRTIPDQYRSEATLVIVPQQVSTESVTPNQVFSISRRVQSITAQLLSRTRLERMIVDLDLYAPMRRKGAVMEDVIQRMRNDIKVDPLGPGGDTFKVAFTSSDPRTTMKVADRLASVFIEEGLNDRARLADGTSEFLETEVDTAKKKLTECDEKLSRLFPKGSRLLVLECDAQADGLKLLLAKQQEARIRANLERRQIGEQFTLLDRARLPERPISPNRIQIAGIGGLAGLLLGLAIAIPSALRAFRTPRPNTATA